MWASAIPERETVLIARLPVASGGMATSGDYERFVVVDGVRHCHILDPRTGRSARGLQSVTVHRGRLHRRRERDDHRHVEGRRRRRGMARGASAFPTSA
jgi:hypothetical protein